MENFMETVGSSTVTRLRLSVHFGTDGISNMAILNSCKYGYISWYDLLTSLRQRLINLKFGNTKRH